MKHGAPELELFEKDRHEIVAEIKARRVTGGAVVRVDRNGHTHCYRVSLRRYNRLLDTLVVHPGAGSEFTRSCFEKRLLSVDGLRESRLWAARNHRRAKHWHATNQSHAEAV